MVGQIVGQKVVLMTGASRGIGFLTALALVREGHYVIAGMRDPQGKNKDNAHKLHTQAAAFSGVLEVVELDVTNELQVNEQVHAIEAKRAIDVLINNAGVMPVGVTEAYTAQAVRDCFETNVIGCVNTNRAVLPAMRARKKGLLIHVSSTAGRLAIPYFGVYCASKWALEALTESMQYELESYGIETVIVEPSGHATDLIANPPAADDLACVDSYGEKAALPGKLIGMFEDMFAAGEAITDAQNVAEKIVNAVNATTKQSLRQPVGGDMGVAAINEVTLPLQNQLIDLLAPMLQTTSQETAPEEATPQEPVSENIQEDERLYVSADIKLKPEHFEQGKQAIESILKPTLAEAGCYLFSLMESRTDANTLHLFEVFESQAALDSHYAQDYTKAIFAEYDAWLEEPIVIRKMKSASAITSMQF